MFNYRHWKFLLRNRNGRHTSITLRIILSSNKFHVLCSVKTCLIWSIGWIYRQLFLLVFLFKSTEAWNMWFIEKIRDSGHFTCLWESCICTPKQFVQVRFFFFFILRQKSVNPSCIFYCWDLGIIQITKCFLLYLVLFSSSHWEFQSLLQFGLVWINAICLLVIKVVSFVEPFCFLNFIHEMFWWLSAFNTVYSKTLVICKKSSSCFQSFLNYGGILTDKSIWLKIIYVTAVIESFRNALNFLLISAGTFFCTFI